MTEGDESSPTRRGSPAAPTASRIAASSLSGLFTRVETGQMVMGPDGYGMTWPAGNRGAPPISAAAGVGARVCAPAWLIWRKAVAELQSRCNLPLNEL
jgi:hypothetical protein